MVANKEATLIACLPKRKCIEGEKYTDNRRLHSL